MLAVSITLSSTFGFLAIAFSAFTEESETLYLENFDSLSTGSLSAAGWSIGDNDVTLTDTGLPTTSNLAVAAIVAAVDSTKKGLEFGLCYNKPTSEYYVRLYDRVNKKQIDKKQYRLN